MPGTSMLLLMTPAAYILIGFGVIIALAGLCSLACNQYFTDARKRLRELANWSSQHGLSLNKNKVYHGDDDCPAFNCLSMGCDWYACNLMEGQWSGRAIRAFDYQFTSKSEEDDVVTQSARTADSQKGDWAYEQGIRGSSAVLLQSEVPLKPLLIRMAGVFDPAAELLGANEIKFESAEFSRAFYVASPDRKWAFDVIHPRAMELLLATPQFEIRFDDKLVMVLRRKGFFSAQDFDAAAKIAQGLLDGLPEYVKEQQQRQTV